MYGVKEIDKWLDFNINFCVVKYCYEIMSCVCGWIYNVCMGKYCILNVFIYILIMRNYEEVICKLKKG